MSDSVFESISFDCSFHISIAMLQSQYSTLFAKSGLCKPSCVDDIARTVCSRILQVFEFVMSKFLTNGLEGELLEVTRKPCELMFQHLLRVTCREVLMMFCGHEVVMMLCGPEVLVFWCLHEVFMAHVVCRVYIWGVSIRT